MNELKEFLSMECAGIAIAVAKKFSEPVSLFILYFENVLVCVCIHNEATRCEQTTH